MLTDIAGPWRLTGSSSVAVEVALDAVGHPPGLERGAVGAVATVHPEGPPAVVRAQRHPPRAGHAVRELPGDVLPVLVRPPLEFGVEQPARAAFVLVVVPEAV